MVSARRPAVGVATLVLLVVSGCGGAARQAIRVSAGATAPPTTTTTAASDTASCSSAFSQLADYQPTEVVRALGGTTADIQGWLSSRPESQGTAPDRQLGSLASDAHIVVCVIKGNYPIPSPAGASSGAADGGRFIILPSGKPVLDGAGPLQQVLSLTPSSIPAAGSSGSSAKGLPAPPACCVSPSPVTPAVLAQQQANDAAFFAKRAAWITANATVVNPATLPTGEMFADVMEGPATFHEAMSRANPVVEGTITVLHFTPNGTTADVNTTTGTTSVAIGEQLEPNSTFTGGMLGYEPGSPVLLPGDRVLLLAVKNSTGELAATAGFEAFKETASGAIESPPGSALFSNEVNGQTLATLSTAP